MSKINLLVTTANGNLLKQEEMIEKSAARAREYAFLRLQIDWDIDMLVTNRLYGILIPEDGVGGRTIASDFIEFAINEEKATEGLVAEMMVHELCHAARWGKNDEWIDSLFDGLISEGIATYFEAEFVKEAEEKAFFIKTVLERSNEENEEILGKLRDKLNSNDYDYNVIFYNGNEDLPRWAGYSLGYYLVKRYLEKTGKTIEEAFADKYDEFEIVL